jgi:nitrogen fixation protein FixH
MTAQSVRPFTGRHMLMIMLAFFGTVIAVNMTMVYFATHSWTGLVVKNSYVASQKFNATTAALEQAAAGVHATVLFANGKLTVSLTDTSGKAVNARNVLVRLGRPSHEGEDQTISLGALGNGVYATEHGLAKGQWSGNVTAEVTGHPRWQRAFRIIVKD